MPSLAATPVIPADGILTVTDGAALSYTVVYEDGDFSVSGMTHSQKAVAVFKDRGATYAVRETEDQEIEFSFSAHLITLRGDGTNAGLEDVVNKKGVWAAATSTLPTANGGFDTYLLSVKWAFERSNYGDTVGDRSVTLKYCRLTLDASEGVPAKISIKGTAYCISTDYLTVV